MKRDALLLRCSVEQADTVRLRAKAERRSVSGYVLNVALHAAEVEEQLAGRLSRFAEFNQVLSRLALFEPGPRTALLVRSSLARCRN